MSEGFKHILDNYGQIVKVPADTPPEALLGYLGRGDDIFDVRRPQQPAARASDSFLNELLLYLKRNTGVRVLHAEKMWANIPPPFTHRIAALYDKGKNHCVEQLSKTDELEALVARHNAGDICFEFGLLYKRHMAGSLLTFLNGYQNVTHTVHGD